MKTRTLPNSIETPTLKFAPDLKKKVTYHFDYNISKTGQSLV